MITNYLALDVGGARIGLATANSVARIASALPAIPNNDLTEQTLQALIEEYNVQQIIVGWPRGLDGQETAQTQYVRSFVERLRQYTALPVIEQDEALTSVKAEAELQQRQTAYSKGEIDSLSAIYILEDFLAEGVH